MYVRVLPSGVKLTILVPQVSLPGWCIFSEKEKEQTPSVNGSKQSSSWQRGPAPPSLAGFKKVPWCFGAGACRLKSERQTAWDLLGFNLQDQCSKTGPISLAVLSTPVVQTRAPGGVC